MRKAAPGPAPGSKARETDRGAIKKVQRGRGGRLGSSRREKQTRATPSQQALEASQVSGVSSSLEDSTEISGQEEKQIEEATTAAVYAHTLESLHSAVKKNEQNARTAFHLLQTRLNDTDALSPSDGDLRGLIIFCLVQAVNFTSDAAAFAADAPDTTSSGMKAMIGQYWWTVKNACACSGLLWTDEEGAVVYDAEFLAALGRAGLVEDVDSFVAELQDPAE